MGQGKQGEFEIPKHTKTEADEEEIEDLEELLEELVRGKKQVKMSLGRGTKGGRIKNTKKEDNDDDFLEDLVIESDPKKPKKPTTYSNLKPGGFVTKAEDCKGRLEKRTAKKETAKDDDDGDDNEEETEKEQLERETRELESELRKTEKAAEKARDKEE